jgi:cyclophilin family peptidyl-prolyl cis-trans isomerase
MRRLATLIWDTLRRRDPKSGRRPPYRRLDVEALELRAVPTASVAPALTGTAFVDHNGSGVFAAGDAPLAGVTVSLDGTSFLGTAIHASTSTRANGTFQFLNVPKGTYELSTTTGTGFLGSTVRLGSVRGATGAGFVAGVPVAPGKNLVANVAVRGLAPGSISLIDFLSSTSANSVLGGHPGPGSAAATGPFVKRAIANTSLSSTTTTQTIDLAANFTAPDITTSRVRLNTALGPINLELFDKQAPQTVQNFIDYIDSGRYNNAIFHRRTTLTHDGLAVLQGGNFTFTPGASGTTLPTIPTFPTVANEVGAPNTPGTIAMAMTSAPNSADSQFFFNLSDNSSALSPQHQSNGGFTVFGKIADAASQKVVNLLAAFPVHNESTFNGALNTIPLKGFTDNDPTFPGSSTASDFALVTSAAVVFRNEALTYTVTSSKPTVATASLGSGDPERLILTRVAAGTTTITVTATDQFGNTASTTFKVTVS